MSTYLNEIDPEQFQEIANRDPKKFLAIIREVEYVFEQMVFFPPSPDLQAVLDNAIVGAMYMAGMFDKEAAA